MQRPEKTFIYSMLKNNLLENSVRYVLAVDTAMNGCSVAMYDQVTEKCNSVTEPMMRGQAERLVPMMMEVIGNSGGNKSDIGLVAVTTGPGAFTGMRIGLSTARAFALALGVPAIGMTTLEVLARQFFSEKSNEADVKKLAVILDTKRSDYYGQVFSSEIEPLTEPFAGNDEITKDLIEGEGLLICGDGGKRFIEESGMSESLYVSGFELIDPCVLASGSFAAWESDPDNCSPDPVYIRGADVSVSKRPQRKVIMDSETKAVFFTH